MNKKSRPLDKEEYETFINTIMYGFEHNGVSTHPNPRICTICIIQANTGLRIGDLLSLKLKNIVYEGGRYHFDIIEEKTKKKRTFTIAPEVVNFLQAYALNNNIRPDRLLFPITSRAVSKHLKKTADYLGYQNVSSHSFRKFFATTIYNDNNFNLELVRTLLQHASQATTAKYIQVSPSVVETALRNHVYIPDIKMEKTAN